MRPALKKLLKTMAKFAPGNSLRVGLLRACGFKIGTDVYIGEELIVTEILEDDSEKLVIGNRVSIAPRVTLVTSSDPNNSELAPSTFHPIRGKIVIGDDAWIGTGVIILPNITVGERAVVGAGSVVTRDVRPESVVAGVPARELPSRNAREAGPTEGVE